jgi:hypothetical protein
MRTQLGHRLRMILAITLAAGCTTSYDGADGATGDDAVVERPDSGPRDPMAVPPPGSAVCGGIVCGEGEECCLLDTRCVSIGDPSCEIPEGTTVPRPCARASDCEPGEVCGVPAGVDGAARCGGWVGSCVARTGCTGDGPVCGCDGRNYANACAANAAGVEMAAEVACGTAVGTPTQACSREKPSCPPHMRCDVETMRCMMEDPLIACGVDTQCPEGQLCCGYTGVCYDEARPLSCGAPPDGSYGPCADDVDCARMDGSYWQSGASPSTFCGGPGCGPGGGCFPIPDSCDGTLEPVCGCDGRTYTNACEATRAAVRVATAGEC